MDAIIKKLAITPAKFDKEGDIAKDEFATLTLEIPMDSLTQKKEVVALHEFMDQVDVRVEVTSHKGRID